MAAENLRPRQRGLPRWPEITGDRSARGPTRRSGIDSGYATWSELEPAGLVISYDAARRLTESDSGVTKITLIDANNWPAADNRSGRRACRRCTGEAQQLVGRGGAVGGRLMPSRPSHRPNTVDALTRCRRVSAEDHRHRRRQRAVLRLRTLRARPYGRGASARLNSNSSHAG